MKITINVCDRCEKEVICLHNIPILEIADEMRWSEVAQREVELCEGCATKYVDIMKKFMREEEVK